VDTLRENWRTLNRRMPDIHQDTYTIEGLSHMLQIPRDVITHEIATGELKAERCGNKAVCITREAVISWLERRGPGI
jgi:excisionase family DNA binding protein